MDYSTPGLTCKSCGAPVTTEICPYCGNITGLDSEHANMDYPVLDCKEATLNFWTVVFPLLFAVTFGMGGAAVLCIALTQDVGEDRPLMLLFSLPFLLVGIGAWVALLRPVINFITIKAKGKHIEAVVCGYVDDNVIMNGRPAQVVKLLADTPVGKRYLMYQLGGTDHPYGINQTVGLWVYKDKFLIDKNREQINW